MELYELDIRTLPDKLTATFDVDISSLNIGDQLLVSDLPKHEGWEVLTPEDTLILRIAPPVALEEPAETETAEPAAVADADEGKTEE
ncbi:50S ribosomal protein L25/general stress protein Ctc [compost metagenome]